MPPLDGCSLTLLALHHHPAATAELEALVPELARRGHRIHVLASHPPLVSSGLARLAASVTLSKEVTGALVADTLSRSWLAQCSPSLAVKSLSVALRRRFEHLSRYIKKLAPDVVLGFDRNPLDPVWLTLRAAGELGVPRLRVPFAESSLESLFVTRRNRSQFLVDGEPLSRARRDAAAAWPRSVRSDRDGTRFFFFDAKRTIALCGAGLGAGDPWRSHDLYERVCLFSENEARALGGEEVVPARMRVTGQPSLARLAEAVRKREAVRAELEKDLGIAAGSKLCLFAPSALVESRIFSVDQFWREASAAIRALRATGWSTATFLHPKMAVESYVDRLRELNAKLLKRPLVEVLPAADLYLAHQSSTVRWATAAGVPTIVLDTPSLGRAITGVTPGVRVVGTMADLAAALVAPPVCEAPTQALIDKLQHAPDLVADEIGHLARSVA